MKIWTCGSSPRSESRNAWTRIKNVNGASLSNIWKILGAIQMISCWDWWPRTKPDYTTTTRRQSNNQWSGGIASYPAPKKIRVQKSAGKVLASIFWDQDNIHLIDYLPKGQTINAEYYSSMLVQLKDILKEKRCGKATKGVLFLHDNSLAHRPLATQNKLAWLGFQFLDHRRTTTCSLDWKKQLKGRHFSSDAEVLVAAETWLDGQPSGLFFSGLQKLEQWTKKCIELRGEYVE